MTNRQRDALRFIRAYLRENEIGPSYEEICVALGLKSKSGAHRLVHGLVAEGRLRLRADAKSGKHRTIEAVTRAA